MIFAFFVSPPFAAPGTTVIFQIFVSSKNIKHENILMDELLTLAS